MNEANVAISVSHFAANFHTVLFNISSLNMSLTSNTLYEYESKYDIAYTCSLYDELQNQTVQKELS